MKKYFGLKEHPLKHYLHRKGRAEFRYLTPSSSSDILQIVENNLAHASIHTSTNLIKDTGFSGFKNKAHSVNCFEDEPGHIFTTY